MNELSGLGPARLARSADDGSAQLAFHEGLGKVLLQGKVRWPKQGLAAPNRSNLL